VGCPAGRKIRQDMEREAAQEAYVGDGHVFTMEDGRALDPAYVTRLFQKLRRHGEPLPELIFHGLRHSYPSLMLASGADISIVSKRMGHPRLRSPQTSMRTCSKASASRQ
jgi:site-specific recombinase XerD